LKVFIRFLLRSSAVLCSVAVIAPAIAQTPVAVTEYYNKTLASYFMTARQPEKDLLDSRPDLFTRTGMSFQAFASGAAPAGYDPVCRYEIKIAPTNFSNHFYGLPSDCTYVASAIVQYNLTNFIYENLDFAVQRPNANGTCPATSPIPIYRSFRVLSPVNTSNHRYSVSQTSYATMTKRGWKDEGVVFCVSSATDETPRPTYAVATTLKNRCSAPRVGVSPITGQTYPDQQGTTVDEKSFLRSFVDETYLWYREVEVRDPAGAEPVASYFSNAKTFAKTNSLKSNGTVRDKDEFHFTQATESAEATSAGIELSYGIEWSAIASAPPRNFTVVIVSPGSPAALAGVKRGDKLLTINGIDFVSGGNVAGINSALFPNQTGPAVPFVFQPADGSANRAVSLAALQLAIQSVPVSSIISTPTGKVGYLALTTFNTFKAEDDLVNAMTGLRDGGVNDLVVDLRYNGGGYIYISSQFAYMVAGASRSTGKAYSKLRPNDKTQGNTYPFYDSTSGFGALAADLQLPTLNLGRVYVLTGPGSCSASESFINGLKGIDVEVVLIGGTSCGKPYGFSREDNCGTSYYSIQFTSLNAKDEGDYINGFAAKCSVSDDLTKDLGSTQEKQLAAALSYRTSGVCPAASFATKSAVIDSDASADPSMSVMKARSLSYGIAQVTPRDAKRGGTQPIAPREPSKQ
jgi:carboxyl-terminal processing protease